MIKIKKRKKKNSKSLDQNDTYKLTNCCRNTDTFHSIEGETDITSDLTSCESFTKQFNEVSMSPHPKGLQKISWIYTNSGEWFMGAVIVLNSIFLGFSTLSRNKNIDQYAFALAMFVLDISFLIIFFFEAALKIKADKHRYLFDPFNVLDLVLLLLSLAEIILYSFVIFNDLGENSHGTVNIIRLFRILKLIRLMRVLRFSRKLWVVVQGILQSLVALVWTALFLFVVLYGCAVFCTLAFTGAESNEGSDLDMHWGSLHASLYTLFRVVTLDSWTEVAAVTAKIYPWSKIFFVLFICFAVLTLMNVVTGVILDSFVEVSQRLSAVSAYQKLLKRRQKTHRILRDAFGLQADSAEPLYNGYNGCEKRSSSRNKDIMGDDGMPRNVQHSWCDETTIDFEQGQGEWKTRREGGALQACPQPTRVKDSLTARLLARLTGSCRYAEQSESDGCVFLTISDSGEDSKSAFVGKGRSGSVQFGNLDGRTQHTSSSKRWTHSQALHGGWDKRGALWSDADLSAPHNVSPFQSNTHKRNVPHYFRAWSLDRKFVSPSSDANSCKYSFSSPEEPVDNKEKKNRERARVMVATTFETRATADENRPTSNQLDPTPEETVFAAGKTCFRNQKVWLDIKDLSPRDLLRNPKMFKSLNRAGIPFYQAFDVLSIYKEYGVDEVTVGEFSDACTRIASSASGRQLLIFQIQQQQAAKELRERIGRIESCLEEISSKLFSANL